MVLKGIHTPSGSVSGSFEVLTLGLMLGNGGRGGGVDFQASQCIPMDPDAWVDAADAADADAAARCGLALKLAMLACDLSGINFSYTLPSYPLAGHFDKL